MLGKLADHTVYDNDFVSLALKPGAKSPVIITMPHAGPYDDSDLAGQFRKRNNGLHGQERFLWPVVRDIILARAPVTVVRGMLPRGYLDYNRALEGNPSNLRGEPVGLEKALEDEALVRFYNAYHDQVEHWFRDLKRQRGHENSLLLDVHGFKKQPDYQPHLQAEDYDLILGTDNRKTVHTDVDRRLARFMTDRDYRVFLPGTEPVVPGKPDWRSGQYTVKHYAKLFGVDAVQLEVASHFRVRSATERGQKLSRDLAEFLTTSFS